MRRIQVYYLNLDRLRYVGIIILDLSHYLGTGTYWRILSLCTILHVVITYFNLGPYYQMPDPDFRSNLDPQDCNLNFKIVKLRRKLHGYRSTRAIFEPELRS